MNGAFYVGATALNAQERALAVYSNNISNLNTPGFKRSSVHFSELVAAPRDENGEALMTSSAPFLPIGVTIASPAVVWQQGSLRQTGNGLDIAIDGEGFLELLGPDGQTMLWRGGTLKVNADGYLAAADGSLLQAIISVPEEFTAIRIALDGSVFGTGNAASGDEKLGQIDLVYVLDANTLVPLGGGFYEAADPGLVRQFDAGTDGRAVFRQGQIEQSNVTLADEMVTLLLLQRTYGAAAQVVQAGDQLMAIANGLRRQ